MVDFSWYTQTDYFYTISRVIMSTPILYMKWKKNSLACLKRTLLTRGSHRDSHYTHMKCFILATKFIYIDLPHANFVEKLFSFKKWAFYYTGYLNKKLLLSYFLELKLIQSVCNIASKLPKLIFPSGMGEGRTTPLKLDTF